MKKEKHLLQGNKKKKVKIDNHSIDHTMFNWNYCFYHIIYLAISTSAYLFKMMAINSVGELKM